MDDSEGPPLLWSSVATLQPGPISVHGGHRPPSHRTEYVPVRIGDGLLSPPRPSLEMPALGSRPRQNTAVVGLAARRPGSS